MCKWVQPGPIWIVFACHLQWVCIYRKAFINVQLIFMCSTWISLCLIVFDRHRQRTMCIRVIAYYSSLQWLCVCLCGCICYAVSYCKPFTHWNYFTRATKLLILICFYCRFKHKRNIVMRKNKQSSKTWMKLHKCQKKKTFPTKLWTAVWAIY